MVSADDAIGSGDQYILSMLQQVTSPVILVINKIDLISKEALYQKIEAWKNLRLFHDIVPISALTGFNIDVLLNQIKKLLPEGPKYYPDGMISDHPESFIIAEIVREKIMILTEEEIPHSVAVIIDKISKKSTSIVEVHISIIVERDSQKGILIGAGGKMIKKIGTLARRDIEHMLGSQIMLKLFVRVEANWRNNQRYLREFGYKDE
jgi:GTP-binding protein Era